MAKEGVYNIQELLMFAVLYAVLFPKTVKNVYAKEEPKSAAV